MVRKEENNEGWDLKNDGGEDRLKSETIQIRLDLNSKEIS